VCGAGRIKKHVIEKIKYGRNHCLPERTRAVTGCRNLPPCAWQSRVPLYQSNEVFMVKLTRRQALQLAVAAVIGAVSPTMLPLAVNATPLGCPHPGPVKNSLDVAQTFPSASDCRPVEFDERQAAATGTPASSGAGLLADILTRYDIPCIFGVPGADGRVEKFLKSLPGAKR